MSLFSTIAEGLYRIFSVVGEYVIYPMIAGVLLALYKYVKKYFKYRNRLHSLKLNNDKHLEIQSRLGELRVYTGADRAFLCLFHNGDRYIDGSPIIKYSRVSEVCGPGISSEFTRVQGSSISLVPEYIAIALESSPILIKTKDLPNCRFKRELIGEGIASTMRTSVMKNKDIIGIIGIDYIGVANTDCSETEMLQRYAAIVSDILIHDD